MTHQCWTTRVYIQPHVVEKWTILSEGAVPSGDSLPGNSSVTADKVAGHSQLSTGLRCPSSPSRSQSSIVYLQGSLCGARGFMHCLINHHTRRNCGLEKARITVSRWWLSQFSKPVLYQWCSLSLQALKGSHALLELHGCFLKLSTGLEDWLTYFMCSLSQFISVLLHLHFL